MDSPLALCFDTFTLGHTPILSCWHWIVRMYTGSPFHLEMFWHQSLSVLHIQLGFFIQQSASKGKPRVRFAHIRQLNWGAHWRTPHMLSCSLVQTICCLVRLFRRLVLQKFISKFFSSGHLHIRCAHWGIPYISFME